MLRPSGPVAFFVMPGYVPHAGSPEVERDARGDHDLLFGADEEGEILRTLAPGIFSAGGGAGPITSTYGQFVSIMYEAMIIVPINNGPTADKKFGSHRVRSHALRRWWVNTLAIMNRLGAAYIGKIKDSKQRGELIEHLTSMRGEATNTELANLCLFDADAVGTSWVRIPIFCSNGIKEKTVFIAFLCPDDRISRPWSDGYVFCIETQATWVRIPILAYFLAVQNAIQSDRN